VDEEGRTPSDALPVSDEELARRATEGDEDAERELLDRHGPRLRAWVERRVRGVLQRRLGASDVLQEAFLTAHQRMGRFEDRGSGSFGRWLSRIVERKVQEELRRHVRTAKRSAANEESGTLAAPLARDPSPSLLAMRREGQARIDAVLASLSDAQRLVLRMAHEEGHSIAEIARRLGKKPDTVYKIYGRAAAALTRRLAAGPEVQP
jgi:RNA polymerase sigma-70 factor (ECF subfamily)